MIHTKPSHRPASVPPSQKFPKSRVQVYLSSLLARWLSVGLMKFTDISEGEARLCSGFSTIQWAFTCMAVINNSATLAIHTHVCEEAHGSTIKARSSAYHQVCFANVATGPELQGRSSTYPGNFE